MKRNLGGRDEGAEGRSSGLFTDRTYQMLSLLEDSPRANSICEVEERRN